MTKFLISPPFSRTAGITAMLLSVSLLAGCEAGRLKPAPVLQALHIKKSDTYKERPGWEAFEKLAAEDCQSFKNGGKHLIPWGSSACGTEDAIKFINTKPNVIPTLYAAYHEYGSDGVGELSSFENTGRQAEEAAAIAAGLSRALGNQEKVNLIYADFKKDRWSMGLIDISEADFRKKISDFAAQSVRIEAYYQKIKSDNQARYNAEREAEEKQSFEQNLASERQISLVTWSNPTAAQQNIIDALHTIKFTVRNDGWSYANGRKFMAAHGLGSFRNSLDLSLESCADIGAYTDSKGISIACVKGLAADIKEWGSVAKDRSISDAAWRSAAVDGSINYNPVKYQILFSHWAGMARVYSSKGF